MFWGQNIGMRPLVFLQISHTVQITLEPLPKTLMGIACVSKSTPNCSYKAHSITPSRLNFSQAFVRSLGTFHHNNWIIDNWVFTVTLMWRLVIWKMNINIVPLHHHGVYGRRRRLLFSKICMGPHYVLDGCLSSRTIVRNSRYLNAKRERLSHFGMVKPSLIIFGPSQIF